MASLNRVGWKRRVCKAHASIDVDKAGFMLLAYGHSWMVSKWTVDTIIFAFLKIAHILIK
ncbi:hypothetical protein E2562_036283 [Oryza meyeriana var. granulata]|uniref:Uncharacterized protein n=1 Tax=Oryza meyeriana var. granulata TaxID=110450 RepID=A0A6G1DT96_9ORYZ|nr:hypothetical protein E2562_036283 [Oryza meyeriana var. granulata]